MWCALAKLSPVYNYFCPAVLRSQKMQVDVFTPYRSRCRCRQRVIALSRIIRVFSHQRILSNLIKYKWRFSAFFFFSNTCINYLDLPSQMIIDQQLLVTSQEQRCTVSYTNITFVACRLNFRKTTSNEVCFFFLLSLLLLLRLSFIIM